jgi:hypothetical protein
MEESNEENQNNTEDHEETIEYEMSEEDDGAMDTHDIAIAAYKRADALIELLIRKGVISEEEYDKMEDELMEEDHFEDDEEEQGNNQNSE